VTKESYLTINAPDEVCVQPRISVYITKTKMINCSSTASFSTVSSLLTLFSKFFSSFLRGTCSLSVSHKYLALEEVYLPFRAAFPNNPTLRRHTYGFGLAHYGVVTLCDAPFQETCARPSLPRTPLDYNSVTLSHRFSFWALACSLAATGAILVSFFSFAVLVRYRFPINI